MTHYKAMDFIIKNADIVTISRDQITDAYEEMQRDKIIRAFVFGIKKVVWMGAIMKEKGLNVAELIEILKQLPQDKPFIVSSDEEGNTLFKGVYIEHHEEFILIAGLSGCELNGN